MNNARDEVGDVDAQDTHQQIDALPRINILIHLHLIVYLYLFNIFMKSTVPSIYNQDWLHSYGLIDIQY